MQESEEKTFKLRLKLKTGEEFEAEGSLSFIEKQKEEFLRLSKVSLESKAEPNKYYEQKIIPTSFELQPRTLHDTAESKAEFDNPTAAFGGEERKIYTPKTDIWGYPKAPPPQTYRKKEENAEKYNPEFFGKTPFQREDSRKRTPKKDIAPIPRPESSVWDRIAYCEDEHIIIRRKDKSLNTALAALIILGSAKMLRNASKMSALELSKSLKLSGYLKENERLDRVLSAEIKEGSLVYEGSKRNRDYIITQSGTAKAYTSAERILLNG